MRPQDIDENLEQLRSVVKQARRRGWLRGWEDDEVRNTAYLLARRGLGQNMPAFWGAMRRQYAIEMGFRRSAGRWVAPTDGLEAIEALQQPAGSPGPPAFVLRNLTPRAAEILHLRARGLRGREIAATLGVTESTVERILARIRRCWPDIITLHGGL